MPSFSERHHLKPVRSVLQVDSMDDALRNGLWNVIFHYFYFGNHIFPADQHVPLMRMIFRDLYKEAADTIGANDWYAIRSRFFGATWNEVYDFVEFLAGRFVSARTIDDYINEVNIILEREMSGYRLVDGLITRITSDTEINEIEQATHNGVTLVEQHLRTALAHMSDRTAPDYRNSIKESISAVETMTKLISGDKQPTLGPALDYIGKLINLHPDLKEGFQKLYRYTSDSDGIRHSLMREPDLSFDDAKFMLVACSAFVNYLLAKATKAGITIT